MAYCEIEDAPAKFKSKVWQYFGVEKIVSNRIKSVDKTKILSASCVRVIYPTYRYHYKHVHAFAKETTPGLPRA